MDRPIPSGLRVAFLVHSVVAGLVGVQHLFAPRVWTDLAGMAITDTVTWRVIGAALIGFAVSSWLAHMEESWERVRIVVLMEAVWSVLGAAAILWGLVYEGLPPLEWLNATLLAGFAAVFAAYFLRMRAARPANRSDRVTIK